ncbi:RNA-binding protein 34 isoform X1 [Opisthocomus hoazin]|uniref:RNA-binding protein 34 isoform X1 n=1 Tax=Opisthocomus hoazin TaxID=30419 RepID=UPI003F533E8C
MRPGRRGAGRRGPVAAGGCAAEGYAVGQVAESLCPGGPPAAPLARLFSAAAPPLLVAVAGENKKRKRTEEVQKASEEQSASVTREPPVKAKKARKTELSKAEKGLVNRESALERADEEEEQKLIQNKGNKKKRGSHAITKSVVDSDTGTTVKRQKEKRVDDETVNRRTVFVGNLPVSCTIQALKSLFKEYGPIKSIRFRSLVPAEDTSSKKLAAIKHKVHPNAKFVNAYVVFKEECDAIKALNENGTEISSGFHIRVDIASRSSLHDNKRSVFLGNLSYDISDNAVREHFSVCGGVVAVRVVRDRRTGLGKGFGYVLFEFHLSASVFCVSPLCASMHGLCGRSRAEQRWRVIRKKDTSEALRGEVEGAAEQSGPTACSEGQGRCRVKKPEGLRRFLRRRQSKPAQEERETKKTKDYS